MPFFFQAVSFSLLVLQQCVWFNISVHLVSHGLVFHHQLRTESFNFLFDEDAKNTLYFDTKRNKRISKEATVGMKFMLFKSALFVQLKFFALSKTDQAATNLCNALISPNMVSFGTFSLA